MYIKFEENIYKRNALYILEVDFNYYFELGIFCELKRVKKVSDF